MPAKRRQDEPKTRRKPATTPEARESQLVSLAHDLAEEQILAGTASSQVITHFLKLGSTREKLEQERLAAENALTERKIENLAAANRMEELYERAINAMQLYSGSAPPPPPNIQEDDIG